MIHLLVLNSKLIYLFQQRRNCFSCVYFLYRIFNPCSTQTEERWSRVYDRKKKCFSNFVCPSHFCFLQLIETLTKFYKSEFFTTVIFLYSSSPHPYSGSLKSSYSKTKYWMLLTMVLDYPGQIKPNFIMTQRKQKMFKSIIFNSSHYNTHGRDNHRIANTIVFEKNCNGQ